MSNPVVWVVVVLLVETGKALITELLVPWVRRRQAKQAFVHCNHVHQCGLWCANRLDHEGLHVDARGHEWEE